MFSLIKLDETKIDGEQKKQLRDHERLKIIKNLMMPVKLSPVKKKKKRISSLVAQMVKNLPAMQETRIQSLGGEDPLEKRMVTHSRIFA